MFQRKRWLKLTVIAVFIAVGAAVAGIAVAHLALTGPDKTLI